MKKKSLGVLFLLMLLAFGCEDENAPKPDVFTLMSINIQNINCELESYNKDGEVTGSYVGPKDFRTLSSLTREEVSFKNEGGGRYLMEWSTVELSQNDDGYLGIELSGSDSDRIAYFELSRNIEYFDGSTIFFEIWGDVLPESSSLTSNGLYHEIEGSGTCLVFTHLIRETYGQEGHLSSEVIDYDCSEDSFIDLFLKE